MGDGSTRVSRRQVVRAYEAEHRKSILTYLFFVGAPTLGAYPVLDEQRFAQVMLNLLSNGLKFTAAGGRVRVAARRIPEDAAAAKAGALEVTVSDTGIGIEPQAVARVFERFVRLEHGSRISREGTGLGLSVTKSLAELHGGTIEAESEGSGRGSTFTFVPPLGAAPAPSTGLTAGSG